MRVASVARSQKSNECVDNEVRRTWGCRDSGKDREGKRADEAMVSGSMRLLAGVEGGREAYGFLQKAEAPFHIAGLSRTKEGGIVSKFAKPAFFRRVYPGADLKVTEGGPIGQETGLSPSLPRFRRGDKDGAGVVGGIVRGRKGVQGAFAGSRAARADACRVLRKFCRRPGCDHREGRRRRGARLRRETAACCQERFEP